MQKVKDALIMGLNAVESAGWTRSQSKEAQEIREAIAELENHEGSALSTVIKWAEDYFDHDIITGAFHESLAILLNQYAESYHAKKCEECLANLPAFPHKPEGLR